MAILESRFPQIIVEIPALVDRALETGAKSIVEAAQARVPVATGDLRASIHAEREGSDWAVVAGNSQVFYGHLVEFGTSQTPARPFLTPAAEEQMPVVTALVGKALKGL